MLEFFNRLTTVGKIRYIMCLPFACIIYIPLYVFVRIGEYANKLHYNISKILYGFVVGRR